MTALRSLFAATLPVRLAVLLYILAAPRWSGAQDSALRQLEAYEGVYRIGDHHELVVSPIRMGNGAGLMLADLQSDDLRLLAPSGNVKDEFVAGASLAQPLPASLRLQFVRDAGGTVSGLRLSIVDNRPGAGREVRARRLELRRELVSFRNGDVALAGTVITPPGRGPFPSIVFAHGSEGNDRHSFGPVPLALAARGFAVMVYDKRGTGNSTGTWRTIGLAPLADDLVRAIRMMQSRPGIDPRSVGIYGTSEGGWVAAYAAARAPDVAFVVTVCGGALTKADAYVHKVRKQVEGSDLTPAAADSAVREALSVADSSRVRARRQVDATGFDLRLGYDPAADWRKYQGPVLHLEGEWDVLEPGPQSAAWYHALHAEAGHRDATVKLFPKAHHSLLLGVTGSFREFETLDGIRKLSPGYWATLFRWLDQRAGLASASSHQRRRTNP